MNECPFCESIDVIRLGEDVDHDATVYECRTCRAVWEE